MDQGVEADRVDQTSLDLRREDQPTGQERRVGEAQNEEELDRDQDLQEDQWACDDDRGKGRKVAQMKGHMSRENSYSNQDGQGQEDSPVRASNKRRSTDCNKLSKLIRSL